MRFRLLIAVSLGLLALAVSGGSGATVKPPGAPPVEQATLPSPDRPTAPGPDRIDARLAAVDARAHADGDAAAIVLAKHSDIPVWNGKLRVIVQASAPSAAAAAVAATGGSVEAVAGGLTQAVVPPAELVALSTSDGVAYVRPPFHAKAEAVTDEGVAATNAAAWHDLGRTGAGVKVAIVDLGFTGYAAAQASGELPGSLTAVDYCDGEINTYTAHGTAVAEIVHKMAPDATLYLICIGTEVELAQAEQYAIDHGITIVNHSVSWFDSSRGDGSGGPGTPDATVADARANGILWVNAAGNHAGEHWSGKWSDPDADGWENFSPTDEGESFFLYSGDDVCIALKWDEWPNATHNYDLYLFTSVGGARVASSTSPQSGTQPPTEEIWCWVNDTGANQWFYAAINGPNVPGLRFDMYLLDYAYGIQYTTAAGSVTEPGSSPSAFAVGAACWNSKVIEPFSSRGPTIDNRIKPDITGPDAVSSAVYGSSVSTCDGDGFFGTSAASPHVAGAAALVEDLHPGWSVDQVQAFLSNNALARGASGKDNTYGAGELYLPVVAPKITGFSPVAGPVESTVTVTGSGLASVSDVQFGGVPGTIVSQTATSLKATVPVGADTGTIRVVSPDGSFDSVALFKVTPRIDGFTPASDIRGHSIGIDGHNFLGATKVAFGSLAVPFTGLTITDTHIDATVPDKAVTGKITVTTPAGSGVSATAFTVILPPTVSGFTPLSAPVGATVTVTGTNLGSVFAIRLNGDDAGAIAHVGTTKLTFTVPTPASTGFIEVENPAGVGRKTTPFKVSPKIDSVTVPTRAFDTKGLRLETARIVGHNLGTALTAKVKIGAVLATVTSNDGAQLDFVIPGTATSNKVMVTTPDGSGVSTSTLTVILPPKVTSFSPAAGPVGSTVTVNGANLDSVTSATLNGAPVAGLVHVSATRIQVTVPTPASNGAIEVTNAADSAHSAAVFKVTPKINVFTSAAARGQSVELDGYNFAGATKVTIGAVSAPITRNDDRRIDITVPQTAVTGKIVVTTPSGSGASPGVFTVILPPTVSSFTPASGPVGTTVTVNGTNLGWIDTVDVGAGSTHAITPISPTQIRFDVPAGATTGVITVYNAAGHKSSTATFKVAPRITSFSPTAAPRLGGTRLTGNNFTGTTKVMVGSVEATTFVVESDTSLAVTIPATAVSGTISVTTPDGTATTSNSFRVILPPTITGISPSSGPTGTVVTVTGTDLDFIDAILLHGDYVGAPSSSTATQLQFTVPVGASSGLIWMSGVAGSAEWATPFRVTPTITGFTPASGAAGDTVVITGSGFGDVTSVSIGGTPVQSFTIDTNRQITAVVAVGTDSGPIVVSTPYGSDQSPTDFTSTS